MSNELIATLNLASRLAALWRSGEAAAIVVDDLLQEMGFGGIVFADRTIIAWLRGVRFELPGEPL
jgi:hypothetical protein